MLNVQLIGDRELIQKFEAMPSRVHDALLKKVTALALMLQAKVQSEKLSGQVLHVVTGALRRSIFQSVEDSSTKVIAKVASSGDVKYAGIHEFGGTIPAHEILPNKAKALAFLVGGKQVFAARVMMPAVQMPERSFLRSALTEMSDQIKDGLREAVREGLK
jgi:HK97 gp10 family phage protein